MNSLLHSRKFWLAVVDTVVTLGTLWAGALLAPERVDLAIATIIAIQAPFVVLINGIAKEDAAQLAAGTHITQYDRDSRFSQAAKQKQIE